MLFDTLCMFAERHLPQLRPMVERANLFLFPYRAHEVIPTTLDPAVRAALHTSFFLPFDTVAVEDTASCVLFQDTEDRQRGLGAARRFVEVQRLDGDGRSRAEFQTDMGDYDRMLARAMFAGGETYLVNVGHLTRVDPASDSQWYAEGALDLHVIFGPDRVHFTLTRQNADRALAAATRIAVANVWVGMQELIYLNTPNRFVVEERPARPPKPGPKIPRSDARPRFTFLTPDEIRARYVRPVDDPAPKGTHASPTPGPRRRHTRTLHSERFVHKRGQEIVVEATWVGPDEFRRNGKAYKVRLDL